MMKKPFIFSTTSIVLMVMMITVGCADHSNENLMNTNLNPTMVELTSFQLAEGVDEKQFVETAKLMQENFLNHQAGFIQRALVKGEEGWTDVVYWQDKASFEQAMKNAEASEHTAPFMQMIDFSSVKMKTNELAILQRAPHQ